MSNTPNTPTETAYGQLQRAFRFFNERLWDNKLPECMLTLTRKKRVYGYFGADRFSDGLNSADEIAMNIEYFSTRPDCETISTLVHEMAHLWQQHFGKPSRTSYHNTQWADEMERIGLMPTSTGMPGGKRTGQAVTHYIIDGGLYDQAWAELKAAGFEITWTASAQTSATNTGEGGASEGEGEAKSRSGKRTKFVCPLCESAAWGKPSLKLVCGDCGVHFEPQE